MTFAFALGSFIFAIYWIFIHRGTIDELWFMLPIIGVAFLVDIASAVLRIADTYSEKNKEKRLG